MKKKFNFLIMLLKFKKKALGPIIAIALLLVVSFIAVIGFNSWYTTYQTNIITNGNEQSKQVTGDSLEIVDIVGNDIYIKNNIENNLSSFSLKIDGKDCLISNLTLGLNNYNISSCLENISTNTPDILLITENKIIEKTEFIKNAEIINSNETLNNQSTYFISVWNTYLPGSANDTVVLPLESSGSYNFTIDWGDGIQENISSYLDNNHTYSSPGVYTIRIDGEIKGWSFNNGGDKSKIIDISHWGNLNFGNNGYYFYGCNNLDASATDSPDLNGTTDLSYIFASCVNFNGDLSSWDVSSVTNMKYLFFGATSFNQPLNSWNTSQVTNMDNTFQSASSFNQPLNSWDMSNVTNMYRMFRGASNFNQPLDSWDVSNVNSMYYMFHGASSFNQPLNSWNVSNVTNMGNMFYDASNFDQPLNNWNVSSVTSMYCMFRGASSFNQSLDSWDLSNVTNMIGMFQGASNYSNHDMSVWDVSSVTDHLDFISGAGSGNIEPIWP